MHALDDDQLAGAAVAHFDLVEVAWNDADHFAAAGEHRIGQRPHQPDPRPAVDQADFPLGHSAA